MTFDQLYSLLKRASPTDQWLVSQIMTVDGSSLEEAMREVFEAPYADDPDGIPPYARMQGT